MIQGNCKLCGESWNIIEAQDIIHTCPNLQQKYEVCSLCGKSLEYIQDASGRLMQEVHECPNIWKEPHKIPNPQENNSLNCPRCGRDILADTAIYGGHACSGISTPQDNNNSRCFHCGKYVGRDGLHNCIETATPQDNIAKELSNINATLQQLVELLKPKDKPIYPSAEEIQNRVSKILANNLGE